MDERQKLGFLTNFAAEVPELEGPVVTPRNNTCIVQQELGWQNFATVTCQGVLGTGDWHGETEYFHLLKLQFACLLHCLAEKTYITVKQRSPLTRSVNYQSPAWSWETQVTFCCSFSSYSGNCQLLPQHSVLLHFMDRWQLQHSLAGQTNDKGLKHSENGNCAFLLSFGASLKDTKGFQVSTVITP